MQKGGFLLKMKSKRSKLERDSLGGDKSLLHKKEVNWFPNKAQVREDLYKYVVGEWSPQKPIISKNSNVIVFGDCFAQHIMKFLVNKGCRLPPDNVGLFFYSSQFVNTFSILEQLEWILGRIALDDIEWFRGTSERSSEKKVVLNESERVSLYQKFKTTDIFILSMGLIEVWFNQGNRSLWRKSMKDSQNEIFKTTSFEQNKSNIEKICGYLSGLNPSCKIILQISPIPFNVTFRKAPPLSVNCVGKSILRGAVDEFLREYEGNNIYYYPAYELITYCIKDPYDEDNRHLNDRAINEVFSLFGKCYMEKTSERTNNNI